MLFRSITPLDDYHAPFFAEKMEEDEMLDAASVENEVAQEPIIEDGQIDTFADQEGQVSEAPLPEGTQGVITEDVTTEDVVEEEPSPSPVSEYENIGISKASEYVNIRKASNTDSKILGQLYRGSAATILKRVQKEDGE